MIKHTSLFLILVLSFLSPFPVFSIGKDDGCASVSRLGRKNGGTSCEEDPKKAAVRLIAAHAKRFKALFPSSGFGDLLSLHTALEKCGPDMKSLVDLVSGDQLDIAIGEPADH